MGNITSEEAYGIDDDVLDNLDPDTGCLSKTCFDQVEQTLGQGSKMCAVTGPAVKLNQLLKPVEAH